ncbi:Uncharacterised protein [Mycobacteroides abscessus subsp. massiliense]|nr:Uncharacterised protein [Mycobacteroides abscessus subsp. massiliense]SKZ09361.1 Uncharacterised protein [Mycobacteroides abscessus subsp. massiliense]
MSWTASLVIFYTAATVPLLWHYAVTLADSLTGPGVEGVRISGIGQDGPRCGGVSFACTNPRQKVVVSGPKP